MMMQKIYIYHDTKKKEGWVVGCVKFLEGVDLRAKTIKGCGVKWE